MLMLALLMQQQVGMQMLQSCLLQQRQRLLSSQSQAAMQRAGLKMQQ
jgi:hypothetical protein